MNQVRIQKIQKGAVGHWPAIKMLLILLRITGEFFKKSTEFYRKRVVAVHLFHKCECDSQNNLSLSVKSVFSCFGICNGKSENRKATGLKTVRKPPGRLPSSTVAVKSKDDSTMSFNVNWKLSSEQKILVEQ